MNRKVVYLFSIVFVLIGVVSLLIGTSTITIGALRGEWILIILGVNLFILNFIHQLLFDEL